MRRRQLRREIIGDDRNADCEERHKHYDSFQECTPLHTSSGRGRFDLEAGTAVLWLL
jgi:hypothetical protein